jgi:hypothetical protein
LKTVCIGMNIYTQTHTLEHAMLLGNPITSIRRDAVKESIISWSIKLYNNPPSNWSKPGFCAVPFPTN